MHARCFGHGAPAGHGHLLVGREIAGRDADQTCGHRRTSTASWMLALVLGSSKVLVASGPMVFVLCLPVVYGGALVLAAVAVKLLHGVGKSVVPQRRSVATSSPLSFDMTIARDYRSAIRA